MDHHWNPSHTVLPYRRRHEFLILAAVFILVLDFLLELAAPLILLPRLRFLLRLRAGIG